MSVFVKMSIFLFVILVVIIIGCILFMVYCYLDGAFLSSITTYGLRRFRQCRGVSDKTKQFLAPLVVVSSDIPPSEFSYRYMIPSGTKRRSILITVPHESYAKLNGNDIEDIVDSTENTKTLSGHLFPDDACTVLEVFVRKQVCPVVEFVQETVEVKDHQYDDAY
jgi:hypothetical protein